MTAAKTKTVQRIARRKIDKFGDRRGEIAEAALVTLAKLGYARTSLREIAQNSAFSHGVFHYYFADKFELIMFCVRQYKARCVTRYDEIVASARTPAELAKAFAAGMAETLRDEGTMHRLWYDLRTQSLFESSFQADVAEIDKSLERMIWRIVTEYAALSGARLRVSSSVAYAIFDGLFEQALRKLMHGDTQAPKRLAADVEHALVTLAFDESVDVAEPRTTRARTTRARAS